MRKSSCIWAAVLCILIGAVSGKCYVYGAVLPSYFSDSIVLTESSIEEGEETAGPESLHAQAAALVDGDTGRLLWGKNEADPMAMASTTKIMTCMIALEYGNMDDLVTFSDYAASMPEVKMGAASGETFRLEDLLYAMMLESHNDVAVAIAEHVGGSVEGFAELMNQKAKELGCVQTCFVTPNGLDAAGHQTTAAELGRIAAYAAKDETFRKIIGTRSYDFSNTEGKNYHADNADAFLDQMEGAFGIKTGFTGEAGYCFVGALEDNGRTFISVVLGSGWPPNKNYKWEDTRKLMEYGLEAYTLVHVGEDNMPLGQMAVTNGVEDKTTIYGATKARDYLLGKNDIFQISVVKDSVSLTAPLSKDEPVGWVYYKIDQKVVEQFPIYAESDCAEKTFDNSLWEICQKWLKN